MALETVNVENVVIYKCGDCGRDGCKLWREYQTFLNHQTLRCAACALVNQKDTETVKNAPNRIVDEDGMRADSWGGKTDQIGWLIPAVPTYDRTTFWGYSSCPPEDIAWWKALPT